MRNVKLSASKVAACLLALGAAQALLSPARAGTPAEFFNEFDWAPTAPLPGPTNFEIIFAGNVTCQIPPQNQHNGSTDPFPNPNPILTTYNPFNNTTTVMFSGSPLTPGKRYHFGLNQGFAPTPALKILGKEWTYDAAPASPLPIINVTPPPPPKGATGGFKYAVVYLEASFKATGQTYGSWYEVPYIPAKVAAGQPVPQPDLKFDNFGNLPLFISNSGIVTGLPVPTTGGCGTDPTCSANGKLLNALDFAMWPPPGHPGSRFVKLAAPPPKMLLPTKAVIDAPPPDAEHDVREIVTQKCASVPRK